MKKTATLLVLFLLIPLMTLPAQDSENMSVITNNLPVLNDGNGRWETDYLISGSEPLGRPSGVFRPSNSTIYVSVPDTGIQSGAAIVIFTSANNGESWTNLSALTPATVIPKTKMILGSTDSVYCFFLSGVTVYCWNVLNNRISQVRGAGMRDFDVASSSTGNMYIFFDSLGTNNIPRYGSSDGGVTWPVRALITSTGAHPRVSFSGIGDTLVLNYYTPVLADTATSVIRSVRYRESAAATLAVVGSFSNVVSSNDKKDQFASVMYGKYVYHIYTSDAGGSTDIKCKVSTNSSVSFFDSTTLGAVTGRNEFWFDAKYFASGNGGVNILFITDSVISSSGLTNNSIWNMMIHNQPPNSYTKTNPAVISGLLAVSSPNGYIPTLIPYYNGSGDAGAIWVADDARSRGLYFDRLLKYSALDLTAAFEACVPPSDSVSVLIRKTASPYSVVDSVNALLSGSGNAVINYTNVLSGMSYYIVVKHRNSIETWSKSGGEVFTAGNLTYNFTTAASQAFGSNQVFANGKYCMFTGDPNQDGIVDGGDGALIDNDAANFAIGYLVTDLNCDTIVDGTDAAYADNNAANFVSKITP